MNRRHFIQLAAAGLAGAALPLPLVAAGQERRTFALEAAPGTADLGTPNGGSTAVWQYNGLTPGPVIRARQGEPVEIPFTNRLDQPTTVHWHGLRVDNAMDGVPGMTQPVIAPGERFVYRFTPPDAGTFWYHAHNRSWEQMARGLHGVLIVDEVEPVAVDRDLVLALDDWLIDDEGQIDERSLGGLHAWAHGGRLGNHLTVNGRRHPRYPVRWGERVRLRLVNVANARVMPLRVVGAAPTLVAVDGQPVTPRPLEDGAFTLAPGQRLDLVMDMLQGPAEATRIEYSAGESLVAASLVYQGTGGVRDAPLDAPLALPPNPLPELGDLAGAKRYTLRMEGGAMGRLRGAEYQGRWTPIGDLVKEKMVWALNGVAGLPKEPFFSVPRGETVVIRMENHNRWPHAMHLHGHHFRSLRTEGPGPAPWRDTLLVDEGASESIALVADNPGRWLIHCHMIEHQAGGMVTWFEVT